MLAARLVQQHPWGHPPRILNLFSYTGGFGAAIAAAGPPAGTQITHVDASADVLALAERNLARNSTAPDTVTSEYVQADAFDLLRHYDGEHRRFDVIVCDPPKFAHNDRQVERAARGYKDLNLHAFRLLHGGGYLLTFSCSGAITADLFQKIVFGALADAGRQAQILAHLEAGSDHPVALTFPEGVYLKGLLLRVY
jgi:23S rRNA (cytosine1962-C5)-methyltransferase